MKRCVLCGVEIIPGENGCAMYNTCTTCKPIHYPPVRRNWPRLDVTPMVDFENLILERQEMEELA